VATSVYSFFKLGVSAIFKFSCTLPLSLYFEAELHRNLQSCVSSLDYLSDMKSLQIFFPHFLYLFENCGFSVSFTKVCLKKLADIELSQFG